MGRGDPVLRITISRSKVLPDDPFQLRRCAINGVYTFIKIEHDGFSVDPDLRLAKRMHRLLGKRIAEAELMARGDVPIAPNGRKREERCKQCGCVYCICEDV